MLEVATDLLSKVNRPLGLTNAVLGLFLPSFLTIFLTHPDLLATIGLNGVLLLSAAIGLPIVMLCYCMVYVPIGALRRAARMSGVSPLLLSQDPFALFSAADPLEVPCLVLSSAILANPILFGVSAVAYFKPIRIGATYVLVDLVLLVIYIVEVAAVQAWLDDLKKRNRSKRP